MLLLYSPYGLLLHALSRPSSSKVITPKRKAGPDEDARKELPKARTHSVPVYKDIFKSIQYKVQDLVQDLCKA